MQLFLALEQIDAIFQSLQFKHVSTSDPERLPGGMLPCAPAHVKMQDIACKILQWEPGLLAYCLPGLTSAQIDETALMSITRLPDQPFFDVTTAFLREVDAVYFNDCTLQDAHAVHIRSSLAKKIMTTRGWNRHVRDHSTSTEFHFGPAIAAVLFNDYWGFQPPKCYLYPKGIDHLDPFLPLLKEVAEAASFSFQ